MSIIEGITVPPSWTLHPFGRVTSRVRLAGRPDLEPLSVFLDDGVIPRASREDNHNQLGEDLGKYLVVQPGDIVFNKLRTWQGGLGVSRYEGIVSPAYFVCRPTSEYDPRYLHYLLHSQPYLQELTRISKWMPPSQFDIGWEQLRLLPVLAPNRVAQGVIADYLDRETVRVDALIAKKRRVSELIDERFWGAVEQVFRPLTSSMQPLARAVRSACDGPFGSGLKSSHYTSAGARVVRLGNLGRGVFRDEDEAFISLDYYHELLRHEVVPGDLLVAGLGDEGNPLGRACVAPNELGPAIVKADCFRLRLHKGLDPHFAAWWLSSELGGSLVLALARGSTRQRANLGSILRVPIPRASEEVQGATVAAIEFEAKQRQRMTSLLSSQIHLLTERRQALITAAVTGEINVPVTEAVA